MAIAPIEIFRPGGMDAIGQILAGGINVVSDAIHSAISIGKSNADLQLGQERNFLSEQRSEINLNQRRGENIVDQYNKNRVFDRDVQTQDRAFAENIFQDRRDFAESIFRADRGYDLAVTSAADSSRRADQSLALSLDASNDRNEDRTAVKEEITKLKTQEADQLRTSDRLFTRIGPDGQEAAAPRLVDGAPVEEVRAFVLSNSESQDPELRRRVRIAQDKLTRTGNVTLDSVPPNIVDEARSTIEAIKVAGESVKTLKPGDRPREKMVKEQAAYQKRLDTLEKAYPGLLKGLQNTKAIPTPGGDWLKEMFK